ncbi:glycosyltransferase [Flavobacterium sp. 245]|uniref:glycosyltransferase n=1 Tax=Flavobacterium sp. 245 TaxID=2512115 RepID=UPI00105C887E|nr:glycosyltransferase [Flavobacterium sp. 245]TDP00902.1 rhamnosyltransferase [Flavobacterium sp. 245]
MKRIKILVATYNGAKYISEQLESILNQKDVDVDVFISDDGSTDNTLQVIKNDFPDLITKTNTPGTGAAATNFLNMVSNLNFDENFDYVAFSDQDDIWLPQKMKNAVEKLDSEQAHLYCSNLTKWDTATGDLILLKKDFAQRKYDFLFEGGSAGCTYVFTKDFAKDFQFFLKDVQSVNWKYFSHDWLTYFFARSRNLKVVIDSQSYIHYRLHDSNVHGHLNKLSIATIREKSKQVLNGYYQSQIKEFIKYLDISTEEYKIYKLFLGNYFQRNYVIWKYNKDLMRDNKKKTMFIILNLLNFR